MSNGEPNTSAFPADTTKHRPLKIIFKVDVARELDRAVEERVGGYANRHELVNDLVEQGLIDLRYPSDDVASAPPPAPPRAELAESAIVEPNGHGDIAIDPSLATPKGAEVENIESLDDLASFRIVLSQKHGLAVENQLARVPREPMFGMHNRDAPSVWALARLAAVAADGPVPLPDFYERATEEAWVIGSRLARFEEKGAQKLAIMLPRNADKPQSAAAGFRAFALGQIASKPEDGMLAAWGPFYQWGAVGIVGDVQRPEIGLTNDGWGLVRALDGLAFALPHGDTLAWGHDKTPAWIFLAYLQKHAAPDLWGFLAALDGAAHGLGRVEMTEWFRLGLGEDFADVEWKGSVAESVASGYISRCRAWGLLEPKLGDGKYHLTPAGQGALDEYSSEAGFPQARAQYERRSNNGITSSSRA